MEQKISISNKRIDVIDVLRAIAIGSIFLLHSMGHFNFYHFPETDSMLLKFIDSTVWNSLFFIFEGKSYGIFSLLFGFSFFIQRNNRIQKGSRFTWRFAWRLLLLLILGNINAIFFTGEVLVLYALVGVTMLLIAPLKSKTILFIAAISLLQPYEWGKLIYALLNPDYVKGASLSSFYFSEAHKVLQGGSFWETVKMNLSDGQMASLTWGWNNGRFFQTASLFMLGYLMGRHNIFSYSESNIKLHIKVAIISLICFFPLNGLSSMIGEYIPNKAVLIPLRLIISSLSKFSFMLVLVSSVTLLFYKSNYKNLLLKIAPYGKMTLTNYIMQSMIGSLLFYGWGFGLYEYLGKAQGLLLGIILLILQYKFSVWWMSRHKHGPLEYLWHKATWIGSKK